MIIENFIEEVSDDCKNIIKKSKNIITYDECFKNYLYEESGNRYNITINLLTLDILPNENCPYRIINKIRNLIKSNNIIKWKYIKENRAFLEYLTFKYKNYHEIRFKNSESPDFIISLNNTRIGIEVTEAINSHYAQYNKIMYMNCGQHKEIKEYNKCIDDKHKNMKDKCYFNEIEGIVVSSPSNGLVNCDSFRKMICEAIIKKINKYNIYTNKVSEKKILVFTNTMAFANKCDYLDVGRRISEIKIESKNQIKDIEVLNINYKILVSYKANGKIKNVCELEDKQTVL